MSSSKSPRILRIPRSDELETYVLVHVSRSGSAPLDLKLAATEGENPYIGSIKQSRLKSLRAKTYQGSDDEWVQILSHVFGQLSPSESSPDSGIEISASISGSGDEDKEIVITIRKRIETITQRLGSVVLKQDDEQAFQLFDWSSIAVARADALEQQVLSLGNRYRAAEDTIQKLNAQLEELIRAKVQHENQLITNFVQLLNEKKLKIRNQQRLLTSATVDPVKVSEVQTGASGGTHRPVGKGRSTKRSALELSGNEPDSDDGFEKMEIDEAGALDDPEENRETDDGRRSTPQPLEEEDNTTTDEEFAPLSIEQGRETCTQGPTSTVSVERPVLGEPSTVPPRRELPFIRRAHRENKSHQTEEEPEETAGETDDEL